MVGGQGMRVLQSCLNEVDFKIRIRTEILNALFKGCDKKLNLKDFENESDMK